MVNHRRTIMGILCALAGARAVSTAEDDLVTSLPGAESIDLPTMYSGYLDVPNSEKHIHYWFVEAPDAELKPVALWTNGGPGCSG